MPAAQAAPPSTGMVPVAQNMSGRYIKPHRQGWASSPLEEHAIFIAMPRGLFRCDINSERKARHKSSVSTMTLVTFGF